MNHKDKMGYSLVLLLLVTACALPLDTFNKKFLLAEVAVKSVDQTGITLLKAGKLTKEEAKSIYDKTDILHKGLLEARKLSKIDVSFADDRLDVLILLLKDLQLELDKK